MLRLPASRIRSSYDIYKSVSGDSWSLLTTVKSKTTTFSYPVRAQPGTAYQFTFAVRFGGITSNRSDILSVTTGAGEVSAVLGLLWGKF